MDLLGKEVLCTPERSLDYTLESTTVKKGTLVLAGVARLGIVPCTKRLQALSLVGMQEAAHVMFLSHTFSL